ncbi:MAG: hypothetical protein L0G38_07145 [Lactococcus sp.]|nr:hypothetical protein [Lactococcus sp.]
MSSQEIRAIKEIKANKGLTRDEFYKILKSTLDGIIFPGGAPRGVYYNYYKNRE